MFSAFFQFLKKLCCFSALLIATSSVADQITVAVASNFSTTAEKIAGVFEENTGHEVILAFGSTGQHYAQISQGAPFDVFLAADAKRPELLEQAGQAISGTRFTYALGRLVLWSAEKDFATLENLQRPESYSYLAIANPRFAPYGLAAVELLESLQLSELVQQKLVMGENISQTFQFVQSGSAQLGLVSLSQVLSLSEAQRASYLQFDHSLYRPIRQQAVQITQKKAAQEFMRFLATEQARKIILAAGYGLE